MRFGDRNTEQPTLEAIRDAVVDAFPLDRDRPDDTATATFGLGCFWGPDAKFGTLPGVVATRAGYAGGTKDHPRYRALGDHTEVVQVDHDPSRISYGDLLDVFWESHDSTADRKTQYRSVILVHDDEQLVAAEQSLAEQEDGIRTAIEELDRFWPAEHEHQKYRLRGQPPLLEELTEHYAPTQLIASTVAARCNGYVAGFGTRERLEDEIDRYGISDDAMALLRDRAGTHTGPHC